MRLLIIGLVIIMFSIDAVGQDGKIKFESKSYSENIEITDILRFEGIHYLNLKFTSNQLANKSYCLTVKEIWNGELKNERILINTSEMPFDNYKTVNDSVLKLRIIAKQTDGNKLKMTFNLPHMSNTTKLDAVESDSYSLRVIAKQKEYDFGEKFYLLSYMLPYEKDGNKFYCAVEQSGKDIESWGKEFKIQHYLIFEMEFK